MLGHPLGCFAERSVAPALGALGAWRENLVGGGGNCSAPLSAGSLQGSALKCQSLGLLHETSPQHSLGTPCSRSDLPVCLSPARGQVPCYPTPSLTPLQAGGDCPTRVGVLLCLALLGAPLPLPLQLVSLAGVPLPVLHPKSCSGGASHGGGCSPKRVSHGQRDGVPADTKPLWGGWVCPALGTHMGWAAGVGKPSFGPGVEWQGARVPGRVGECW